MECLSFCIANTIDLVNLENYFKNNFTQYSAAKFRDVLKVSNNNNHLLFIFKNGTVVTWGVKRYQTAAYLQMIKPYAYKPISFLVHDEFSYCLGNKIAIQPHDFFDVDCVTIDEDSEELKLGLSYGFSQSVKLQYFEIINESLIEKYSPLIEKISTNRKMVSRSAMRQVIGQILAAKSEMNLISNFLYHPKFFWQHPTLEEYFIMLERYLHIPRRTNAINHRLNTLSEIFDMFNDYLENRHSHHLEIIIIVLITIEIGIAILKVYF